VPVIDVAGNPVPGATVDAGSLTATASDATVLLVTAPAASGADFNVQAVGPEATGETVSVAATLNGTPVSTTFVLDVTNSAGVGIGVTPGTPQTNA
jgi:hypothetical protein